MNVDDVKHPAHYTQGSMQLKDVFEAKYGEYVSYFYRMNIEKYVTRYEHKGGIQDLQKAAEYLEFLIDLERRGNGLL